MKKKLGSTFIALVIGFLFTDAFAQKEIKGDSLVLHQRVFNDSTMKISSNIVVPANQTFYVYDENRTLIGTYTDGNTLIVPVSKAKKKKALDCAKIPCPKTFRRGTTCWQCK